MTPIHDLPRKQIPEIAIIDPNTLASMGLRSLLEELIPQAVIRCFRSFAAFVADTPDMYAHYFLSAQIYFEHTAFFLERRARVIVLTSGAGTPQLSGVLTLDVSHDEQQLARNILRLHQYGHRGGHPRMQVDAAKGEAMSANQPAAHDLSAREIEVLTLLVRGLINKEIADRLNIGLTTVISHRKNITEKLGIKSLSGLTIYAVMHGYVEADSV